MVGLAGCLTGWLVYSGSLMNLLQGTPKRIIFPQPAERSCGWAQIWPSCILANGVAAAMALSRVWEVILSRCGTQQYPAGLQGWQKLLSWPWPQLPGASARLAQHAAAPALPARKAKPAQVLLLAYPGAGPDGRP